MNQLVQFYSNNVTDLHRLTLHSRPTPCCPQHRRHFTLCITVRWLLASWIFRTMLVQQTDTLVQRPLNMYVVCVCCLNRSLFTCKPIGLLLYTQNAGRTRWYLEVAWKRHWVHAIRSLICHTTRPYVFVLKNSIMHRVKRRHISLSVVAVRSPFCGATPPYYV